jgi:hypothetical protein
LERLVYKLLQVFGKLTEGSLVPSPGTCATKYLVEVAVLAPTKKAAILMKNEKNIFVYIDVFFSLIVFVCSCELCEKKRIRSRGGLRFYSEGANM